MEIWVAFDDYAAYDKEASRLEDMCFENQGTAEPVVYLKKEKSYKKLGRSLAVDGSEEFTERLKAAFGEANVRIRELTPKFER